MWALYAIRWLREHALGIGIAARAWAVDPCVVDDLGGPRPCLAPVPASEP